MKKLRTGTNLIRIFLILGAFLSLAGILLSLIPIEPNHSLLAALFAINIVALLSVIRILTVRNLPARIRQIGIAMNRAADGELSEKVAFEGETEISLLADNFNSMMEKLSGAISKVKIALDELRNISASIRLLSEKGVASADQQSESLKRTSAGIRGLNHSINDIAAPIVTLTTLSASNTNSMAEMSASLATSTMHLESLSRSVDDVSSSIIEMASAARQIKENAGILASDTSSTANLVSEMNIAIKQIGTQSIDTSRIAETIMTDAEDGWKAVDATISGINEIKKSSAVTFDAIENLSGRVSNIGKILSVIDGVAEQTNLLALNASIIAAQAGDRGKSFSVVASEIKDLAKRTGNHTREISEIILGVREETERAVKAITLSEQRISEGSELSHRSGAALRKIVNGIQAASSQMVDISKTAISQADASAAMQKAMDRVAEMVIQIAQATHEQSRGSELITSSVEQMRNITKEVVYSIANHQNSTTEVKKANEEISKIVVQICEASTHQAESSKQIEDSLDDFEESAKVHVDSTMVMDEVLLKLASQINVLQNELKRFNVNY